MLPSRRTFLVSTAALGSAITAQVSESRFRHRGYLGWITDLASQPDPRAAWPSMRLDAELLRDYRETFALMKQLGFNEISVWGLYVAGAWPVDIRSVVTPERAAFVRKLIDSAHRDDIRVYSGLGVYSWGFEEVIQAHPNLSRGDRRVMCASEPEAWEWMRRVVDYVFERFPIDGVSMQSADQGRCRCDRCKLYSDAEYHALLNVRVAEYIRSRWPGKTIGVNSWGLRFEAPETLPSLVKTGRAVDYIIDVHDSGSSRDPAYRKKIIQAVSCPFGTLGGPQTEPPQHWTRDRWFLPTLNRVGRHLEELFREGGRACEFFFHIRANPGDEVCFWAAGRTLAAPRTPWMKHAESSVEQLYRVTRVSARDDLLALFLEAEEAYFRHLPPNECGTISLEPLVGDRPGPPVYLSKRLNAEQRKAYRGDLNRIRARAAKLAPDIPDKVRMRKVLACLDNVLSDLDNIRAAGA